MLTLQKELSRFLGGSRPRRVDHEARERRQFKALAAKHGFTFTKTRDGYVELTACSALPRGLTTAHYGWPETLERVQACIADPSLVDAGGYYSE